MRNLFVNLCLLLASCVVGLSLCEVSLRLFYPKYRHLTETQFRLDERLIFASKPNNRGWFRDPDTLSMVPLHRNNLGLRQHRNFSAADLASATNIGFFGDSWTENRRMAAAYSFTEPLDYLLNQGGQRFNILNFGVEGYGTGQSFLRYRDFRYAKDLDYVVYVYCDNDLDNLYENRIFDLDDAGHLVENRPLPSSGWIRWVSRLHLSYLVLDGSERLSHATGERAYEREEWKRAVFRQLLRRWKHLVESNGTSFYVVTLPEAMRDPFLTTLLAEEESKSVDLFGCFGDLDPKHKDGQWLHSPYRFKNDGHWNKAGNQLAAVCLYRVLEKELGLQVQTEEDVGIVLLRYYAAFGGWMPMNTGGGGHKVHISATTARIREKYEAFGSLTPVREKLEEMTADPSKLVIASDFDVYFDGKQLTYIKEECNPTDLQRPFFLHVMPVDENDPPERRVQYGYIYTSGFKHSIDQNRCITSKVLPRYPIRYLWTGQYDRDEGILWEGESAIDRNNVRGGAEFVPAAGKRVIASDFDVYLDGKQLTYVKKGCRLSDWQAPFFLHVFPVATDALPPDRVEDGYDRLDFNKSCRIEQMLPAYAIGRIHTGQHHIEKGRLWEGESAMDPDNSDDEGAEFVPGLSKRIISSDFDVYLDGRRLIYKKEDCRSINWDAKFFLHVVPVDNGDLPAHRVHHGFNNLDFSYDGGFFHNKGFRLNEFGCTRRVQLPAYAVHRIRTGQFVQYDDGSFLNLWEGEFSIKQDVGGGADLARD